MGGMSGWAHNFFGSVVNVLAQSAWLLWRLIRGVAIAGIAVGASIGVIVAVATWQRSLDLPGDYRELLDARKKGAAVFYASSGELLGVRGDKHERARYEEVSPVVVDAILATEDQRYFWHTGFDPLGIARALLVNWRAGRTEQGGSSVTQQVAKSFVGAERDIGRKFRELAFALALEYKYTKREILEMYMNRVYLGAGSFGFRAAAKTYFNAKIGEITPAQAALLAGLLRAPSKWSPTSDFEAAQDRARVILKAMYRSGKLTDDEYTLADTDIELMKPPKITERASYFVDWALEEIPDAVWEQASDVVVKTTLDLKAQRRSEIAAEKVFVEQAKRDPDAQTALVVLQKDGAVRVMVGGRDYARSEFNRAASAKRQLGSAFKPFVYAAAFEAGVSAGGDVLDGPVTIRTASGPWSPRNYSRRYLGWIPISVALARSSNVASVRMMQRAGLRSVIDLAKRAGFNDHIPPFPSLALGVIETNPLEVASAYAMFNNSGRRTPAYGIVEISDRRGNVLWRQADQPQGERVISSRNADWMVALLRGVVEAGTGRRAQLDDERPSAGKTGTTQDYSDAWFAGFTGDFVAVVWMGNDRREIPLHRVTGGSIPAMIWKEVMEPMHDGMPVTPLTDSFIARSRDSVGGDSFAASGGDGDFFDTFGGTSSTRTSTRRKRSRSSRSVAERARRERKERRRRRDRFD